VGAGGGRGRRVSNLQSLNTNMPPASHAPKSIPNEHKARMPRSLTLRAQHTLLKEKLKLGNFHLLTPQTRSRLGQLAALRTLSTQ